MASAFPDVADRLRRDLVAARQVGAVENFLRRADEGDFDAGKRLGLRISPTEPASGALKRGSPASAITQDEVDTVHRAKLKSQPRI